MVQPFDLNPQQQRDFDFFVRSLRNKQAGDYRYAILDSTSGVELEVFVRVLITADGRRLFYLIDGDDNLVSPLPYL